MSQPEDRSFCRAGLDSRSCLIQSHISTTTGTNRNPIENPVSIATPAIAMVATPSLATRYRVFQRRAGAFRRKINRRRTRVQGDPTRPLRAVFTPSTRRRTTATVPHKPAATRSMTGLPGCRARTPNLGSRRLEKPPRPLTTVRIPRMTAPRLIGIINPVRNTVAVNAPSSIWSPVDHLRSQFPDPRSRRGSNRPS